MLFEDTIGSSVRISKHINTACGNNFRVSAFVHLFGKCDWQLRYVCPLVCFPIHIEQLVSERIDSCMDLYFYRILSIYSDFLDKT